MIKKNKIKNVAALLLGVSFAVAGAGCDFLLTNNEKDMAQTVAEVNIANYIADTDKYADFADDMKTIIENGGITTDILKRDLVAAFLNVGSTYINSYGYTYRQTFELLMDSLVSRKIMVQYAMVYYLAQEGTTKTADACVTYVNEQTAAATGKVKTNLEKHPEVLTMQYFLGEEDYNSAVYSLKKALNDSLDSAEQTYISAEEESHDHGESRTLPTNVDTEKTDYYPKTDAGDVDYDVYTGRNAPDSCGAYERIDGSTQTTRMKAYNTFLNNLSSNNLILEGENTSNFLELDYYYVELASQLEQALIEKFGEDLTKEAENELTLKLVQDQYALDVETQATNYGKDLDAFETALDGVSDTSFILNAPEENYGFVYNILIPFSAWQTEQYATEKTKGYTQAELYAKRAAILSQVKAKDLRDSWFSEDDHVNYSYAVGDKYYFFKNQTGADKNLDKYESLKQYAGNYAYNGTVTVEEDGSYTCKPTLLSIDGFIDEMKGYIAAETGLTVSGAKYANYVTDFTKYTFNEKNEFSDYSQFIYYTGKVEGLTATAADYFVEGTDAYKAVSAVNELMFAYSTDTGCLNTYMGYVVSPYDTDFVNEFEYAAQYAIRELGVGGYVICPSDYGWHIIYVSNKLPVGSVYGAAADITQENLDQEGSFYNLYYEALKSTSAQNYQTMIENNVLVEYNNGSCVTLYTERYEDLLSIGE